MDEYKPRNFETWDEDNFYKMLNQRAEPYVSKRAFPYRLAVDDDGDFAFWDFQQWAQNTGDLEEFAMINDPEGITWCTWVGPAHQERLYVDYIAACRRMDDALEKESS